MEMYQNSSYNFERNPKKTLIIQYDAAKTSQRIDLQEPLKIDQLSDIYLDSFITGRTVTAVGEGAKEMFILGVSEFNIQSISSASKYNNKVIIPNTRATADQVTVHRANKFNFISTINPTTLSQLNITLTDDDGAAVHTTETIWMTFIIVART
tara:strand:- start:1107 stop:1565 length:459 start_codon:yes stop_codon:yes gene_type:complete